MWYGYYSERHCRWCGTAYKAQKPHDRDGFHSSACKQAHYRAFKKYVTVKPGPRSDLKKSCKKR